VPLPSAVVITPKDLLSVFVKLPEPTSAPQEEPVAVIVLFCSFAEQLPRW
jgi:hypothetical protein